MAGKYWAVIPAAGIGQRMGQSIPKQYLSLHNKPIIQYSLETLVTHPLVHHAVVALHENDTYWQRLDLPFQDKITTVVGGDERSDSVFNALNEISANACDEDWVLVHDAVRPCLHRSDLDRLINSLRDHPVGGLLGAQLVDTMKKTNAQGDIISTLSRDSLWRAFTPQLFRFNKLMRALQTASRNQQHITDEAVAIELIGESPRMIAGREDNIKITRPEDLSLAASLLSRTVISAQAEI